MPLDEDEQRILQQIEQSFYANDPESARRIKSTTLNRYLARNCRWSVAGVLAGLVILLVSFGSSWVLGVFGFAVMVVSALVLIQNLRKIGRLGIHQLHDAIGAHSFADAVAEIGRRIRERFGGDED